MTDDERCFSIFPHVVLRALMFHMWCTSACHRGRQTQWAVPFPAVFRSQQDADCSGRVSTTIQFFSTHSVAAVITHLLTTTVMTPWTFYDTMANTVALLSGDKPLNTLFNTYLENYFLATYCKSAHWEWLSAWLIESQRFFSRRICVTGCKIWSENMHMQVSPRFSLSISFIVGVLYCTCNLKWVK